MRFADQMELRLTVGDAHVVLDALISYLELDDAMKSGTVGPLLKAINQPAATRSNIAELYARLAAQIGDERRDVRYPSTVTP